MEFYKEFSVSSLSQRFIKKIWCLNNTSCSEVIGPKYILPNGCHNIAIVSGSGIRVRTQEVSDYLDSGCYLCAQMTAKVEVELNQNTSVTLIQLYPWTLSTLTDFNVSNFVDRIEKISTRFLGDEIPLKAGNQKELYKLILAINRRFTEIEVACSEGLIEKICNNVLDVRGECKAIDLVNRYELSIRAIQIEFKRSTGLTLKQYIDIIRMRAAVDSIATDAEKRGKITRVAMDHQYFDQAHFIKSFRRIVKLTPSKFNQNQFILSEIKS